MLRTRSSEEPYWRLIILEEENVTFFLIQPCKVWSLRSLRITKLSKLFAFWVVDLIIRFQNHSSPKKVRNNSFSIQNKYYKHPKKTCKSVDRIQKSCLKLYLPALWSSVRHRDTEKPWVGLADVDEIISCDVTRCIPYENGNRAVWPHSFISKFLWCGGWRCWFHITIFFCFLFHL